MTRPSSTIGKLALAAEALLALAAARFVLHRTKPADVQQRNHEAAAAGGLSPGGAHAGRQGAEVAWAITWMSRRLPWRADCLVQALAGQKMLIRRRIASEIRVGTAKHDDGSFEAHAWLVCGPQVLLGGDIDRFEPLLDASDPAPRAD
ncbi:lasso peptide biosynthesis B2 protein [Erythrobacter oryzae]|uniref:lasso peptide biosynthesis B2 protein n=1 Tax=Erythrobacter oryzae TaxID=3019556 RepID=UPI00255266CF|nr:lasso peptide biosynthesis B2 protein [Erythrobacter sp. COR-2]